MNFSEAEHLLAAGLSEREVEIFLDGVVAMSEPVKTHFLWRPQLDLTAEAYEIAKKQRAEIIRVFSACKGHIGDADGAAARRGMNRTTLLSRMKRFGICAKQYA